MFSLLPEVKVVYNIVAVEKQTEGLFGEIIKSHEIQYEQFYVHLIEMTLHIK